VSLVAANADSGPSRRLGGGQDSQSSSHGDRLRPIVDVELAVDIAGVGLDCIQ